MELVECVEADTPGRRRGDEYRLAAERSANGEPRIEDPDEDWEARADQGPAALSAAVAKKIGKRYAGSASLLVFLNIDEFGIRQKEIEATMAPAIAPALPCFQRVWILWKERLYGHGCPKLVSIKWVIKSKLGVGRLIRRLVWNEPQIALAAPVCKGRDLLASLFSPTKRNPH